MVASNTMRASEQGGGETWLAGRPQQFELSSDLIRKRRRMALQLLVGSCLFMVPWIVYLAISLPVTFSARAWSAAWVGFDMLLLAAIAATAYAGWRRLHMIVPLALVTATLLVCDAWFDVMLDWGNGFAMWESLATAIFMELPLAFFFASRARRIMQLTVRMAWLQAGIKGDPPPLHKLPLFIVAALDGSATTTTAQAAAPAQ